jgi:hypothetical protein
MTNYNNNDLYQMLLDRLRKDRKGSVSPEEFESFLRWRNLDYFQKQIGVEGVSKMNHESLRPFLEYHRRRTVVQEGTTGTYYISIASLPSGTTTSTDAYTYLTVPLAYLINAWACSSATVFSSVIEIDVVSSAEYHDRVNNAITGPTAAYPIGYLVSNDRLRLGGLTTGYVLLDYYSYPSDPYFDYYTDASGNVTYLTDGQASYTLQAGEIARDESTAGSSVTSASQDLEWSDQDALQILDMIVSDVSMALSDPNSFQASLLERQQNVNS